MYRVVVLALAALILVGCANTAATASMPPTTVPSSAPEYVTSAFKRAIDLSLKDYCGAATCPYRLAVTGNTAAWDVAFTLDVSGESAGDPMYAAAEGIGNYARSAFAVFHAGLPVNSYTYTALQAIKDDYGNASTKPFVRITMAGDTARQINWTGETVDGFMHLSTIAWMNSQIEQGLAQCSGGACVHILPTDFNCTAVRQHAGGSDPSSMCATLP